MRHAILLTGLLSVLLSESALASDWTIVGKEDYRTVYVDMHSISHQGKYAKGWYLLDYSTTREDDFPHPHKFKSAKFLFYADCSSRQFGSLSSTDYAEQMGGGTVKAVVNPSGAGAFSDVESDQPDPGAVDEKILNVMCGKH